MDVIAEKYRAALLVREAAARNTDEKGTLEADEAERAAVWECNRLGASRWAGFELHPGMRLRLPLFEEVVTLDARQRGDSVLFVTDSGGSHHAVSRDFEGAVLVEEVRHGRSDTTE